MKGPWYWKVVGAAVLALLPLDLSAQATQVMNAAELRLALEKLGVVGSALYVAAHPDDENTAMLAWLASGKKVRTAYLSLTRGDGGQNLIGEEIGPALGVIRTHELLAARRVDGAEQFFTRAVDFGYSKNPEETFANWDRETILSDVVWVVRMFRPDIMITRFPTDASGGHGQHTASARLALEAFHAAGDPKRFPEQLTYVKPWQPRRIMWNHWNPSEPDELVAVDLGAYNALLGRSYAEIAGESRSQHKSQGFGAAERRGTIPNYLRVEAGAPATQDPFEGVNLSWSRIPGAAAVGEQIQRIQQAFDPRNPAEIVPDLVALRKLIRGIDHPDARPKLNELDAIIRSAAGIWLEAIAPASEVTRGSSLPVQAMALRRGEIPVTLQSVQLLASDGDQLEPVAVPAAQALPAVLAFNTPLTVTFDGTVPASAPLSEPYWLRGRDPDSRDPHYPVPSSALRGLPTGPPPFAVRFSVAIGDELIQYDETVQRRWVDRVRGELYETTRVVPPVSVRFDEELLLFPTSGPREVAVTISNHRSEATAGALVLAAPAGWSVTPSTIDFSLPADQRRSYNVALQPPGGASRGSLTAALRVGGDSLEARTLSRIDYEHIPAQLLIPRAESTLVRADIQRRGERVGYIQGSGDEGPSALSQVGFTVVELTDAQIARADLSEFDSIIVGVRAFNAREAARQNIERLHEYVRGGGTLVVQYHTADQTLASSFPPVPLTLGRGRVTVEGAAMKPLLPEHVLLTTPNRLTETDFDDWVQERGLYFAQTWDPAYQTPLASADPGEDELPGGLLYVPYGDGHFIYTGYSFFRQIPAGVPGAIRLFVNLASAGADDETR